MEQPITLVQNGPLTIEIHEGQKGDPGKSLRFEDLTPEQIEQLKGPKGDKGDPGSGADVKEVYDMLVSRGYLPNSSSLNDVLKLIVDKANIIDLFENAILTLRTPIKYGDTVIQVGGISAKGMVLHEKGTENTYTMNEIMQWSYPFTLSHPMDERSVTLEAIWQGQVKSTLVIPGVQANTPVEIASDPVYTNTEPDGNIDYNTQDDQVWLRQNKSPSLFSFYDISLLLSALNLMNKNTVVLDLIADDMIELSNQDSSIGIEYRNNADDDITIKSDKTLIIEPNSFGIRFNNLIVVYPDKPVRDTKSTITFIAPYNIHVGTAVKGTTTVPCIAANIGDVVQIDISNRTAKVIGTQGTRAHL